MVKEKDRRRRERWGGGLFSESIPPGCSKEEYQNQGREIESSKSVFLAVYCYIDTMQNDDKKRKRKKKKLWDLT